MRTMSEIQMQEADLIIRPDLSDFGLVDISAVPEIFEAGYREALPLLETWMAKA